MGQSDNEVRMDFLRLEDDGVEDITVLGLLKDRVIFRPIQYEAKGDTGLISPHTGKVIRRDERLGRYGLRGIAVYVGDDVLLQVPGFVAGTCFFIEDRNAIRGIKINGRGYGITRLSNIFLLYRDNKNLDHGVVDIE